MLEDSTYFKIELSVKKYFKTRLKSFYDAIKLEPNVKIGLLDHHQVLNVIFAFVFLYKNEMMSREI